MVYSPQTRIRLNRGHYIKSSHPFRNTLLLKMWIPQRYIGGLRKCFKVYIAEDITLICVTPNTIRSALHKILPIPFKAFISLWICRLPKRLKCTKGRRPQFRLLAKYIHKNVRTDTDRARCDWLLLMIKYWWVKK